MFTTKNTLPLLLAACFASTIGGLPFNSLPILLGSLSEAFNLTPESAGLLGSICFFGYLLGTLSSVIVVKRFCLQRLTQLCAVLICSMLILSAYSPEPAQAILWAGIGFFAAIMTCLGLMLVGMMANKEQALGMRQGIELTVTAGALFVIPAFITYRFGYAGTAFALAGVIALLGLSSFFLPKGRHVNEQQPSMSLREQLRIPYKAWLALAVFLLFATGNIALWAFLERLGNDITLSGAQQGIVFAVLKVLGGVAAFSVMLVGNRLGFRIPYIIVGLVLFIGLIMIHIAMGDTETSFVIFASGVWIWEVAFTWGCVYQTAAVARFDSTNKAIMLIPTAFALSAMLGPYSGGLLVSQNYMYLLIFTFVSSLIALICYLGPMHPWQQETNETQ